MSKSSAKPTVTIVGGGMVGLLLAALLSEANFHVVVIESKKPSVRWNKETLDARVSAINRVSQRLLEKLTVWNEVHRESYSPLMQLKIWDGLGGAEIDFDSAEIGVPALGAIVENREIVRALLSFLNKKSNVELVCPATPAELIRHEHSVDLILEDKTKISSSIIVGADGAHSWLRTQMNSDLVEKPYEQSAVVTVVQTEEPHQKTGWQAFLPDGILALLPLFHSHRCAIVWSTSTENANQLIALKEDEFTIEINNAFGLRLGEIKRLTSPVAIPLVMRHAKNYVEPRLALVGDAAHTIHPLAGQGVNLGFMDAACLAQCLIDARDQHKDLGSVRVLRRYERWRKGDNALMLLGMRMFKELFGSHSSVIIQARNMGLQLTNRFNFLKNALMRYAIGETDDLPSVAK